MRMRTGEAFHNSRERRMIDLTAAGALSPLAVAAGSVAAVATMAATRSMRVLTSEPFASRGIEQHLGKMRTVPEGTGGTIGRVATIMQRLAVDEALQLLSLLRYDSPLALVGIRPMTDEYAEWHVAAAVDAGERALADIWIAQRNSTSPGLVGPGRFYTHALHPEFEANEDGTRSVEAEATMKRVFVGAMALEAAFMDGLTPASYMDVIKKTPAALLGLAVTGYAGQDALLQCGMEPVFDDGSFALNAKTAA